MDGSIPVHKILHRDDTLERVKDDDGDRTAGHHGIPVPTINLEKAMDTLISPVDTPEGDHKAMTGDANVVI